MAGEGGALKQLECESSEISGASVGKFSIRLRRCICVQLLFSAGQSHLAGRTRHSSGGNEFNRKRDTVILAQ